MIRPSPIPANAPTEHEILASAEPMRPRGPQGPQGPQGPPGPQHPDTFRMPHPSITPSRDDVLCMAAQRPFYADLLKTGRVKKLKSGEMSAVLHLIFAIIPHIITVNCTS